MNTYSKGNMSEKRRCCTKGCTAIRDGYRPDDGWYKVNYGFMYHACPEHAEQWRAFDQAQKTIGKQRGEKFAADHARWEARWNARADRTMPLPTPPELQNSWEISE